MANDWLLIAWESEPRAQQYAAAIFSDPPISSRHIVRRTRGELALASRRHVSTRGWSAVIGAVAGATGLRWLTTVNDGEPPVNHREPPSDHRSTAVGPPVNHPEPPVNGEGVSITLVFSPDCVTEKKGSNLSTSLKLNCLEARGGVTSRVDFLGNTAGVGSKKFIFIIMPHPSAAYSTAKLLDLFRAA
ncbi:hypothetical protein Tco_1272800 [Tanacetum coccineum]